MKIKLVGVGMGNPRLLTQEAREAIAQSDVLIGASRLLALFEAAGKPMLSSALPTEIAAFLREQPQNSTAAVLVSGDAGFYSIAASLRQMSECTALETICGISSLQYFCARLNTAWDDVRVVSLHGREQDLCGEVQKNAKVFVLTGGRQSVPAICRTLCGDEGLTAVTVQVGERLSYPDERITGGTPKELCEKTFDPLAVMLIHNDRPNEWEPPVTHGLSDDCFLRGNAPMTKAEVRAVSIAKLQLKRGQIVWDVGAGTGSVAVEIARVLCGGRVYAIERDTQALALLEQNRLRFHAARLQIIGGEAPLALETLPAPDAVFIGGSAGQLSQIAELAFAKNPCVRIVVNAITLETLGAAIDCFGRLRLCDPEVVQVSVAKAKSVGSSHMMMGQNPVYIISAGGGEPMDASKITASAVRGGIER